MALRGTVRAACPKGCEEEAVEVWSFVRADADEALREAMLAGELNLVSCEHCGTLFFPEATVVYYDPSSELLAFVFPESYRGEEARWRAKMAEDFEAMRGALAGTAGLESEPILLFGMEECRELLRREEDVADQVRVAELIAKRASVDLLPVSRAFARARRVPWRIPCAGPGKGFTQGRARAGLSALLAENGALEAFRSWTGVLDSGIDVPLARLRT